MNDQYLLMQVCTPYIFFFSWLMKQLSKLKDEKDQERSELRQKLDGKIMGLGRDVADLTKMCSASETREKELRAENVCN